MSRSCLSAVAVALLLSPALAAQEKKEGAPPEKPPIQLSEQEQAFVDLLTDSVLVGHFSVQGRETPPGRERYAISRVAKLGENQWLVVARITYGDYDLPVPVPVSVVWAGDTPVLQVTKLTIPGLGEGFTSRVLFYGQRYAGTWQHGEVGGNMWGTIERSDKQNGDDKRLQQPDAPKPNQDDK